MRELEVTSLQAGQRLDKLLGKYLKEASGSFLHKMLRKKNITLNGRRADGSEKVAEGDLIRIFLRRKPWKSSRASVRRRSRAERACRSVIRQPLLTFSMRMRISCL